MKNRNNSGKLLLAIFLLCLFGFSAYSQSKTAPRTIFEKLGQEEGSKMTLEMDFTMLANNRKSDEYYPASLTGSDGKMYKVEVKPRGKYRRRIAEIPPLKVKFKKKALIGEGLDTLNEIKLVLPCYDNEQGDELVVKEYLAYRMFEKLTGVSMRARLVRLSLHDSHVESSSKRMVLAILLEDEEELTTRLNGILVEQFGTPIDSFVTQQAALVVMFEYMIGNTDWDLAMHRNVRFIKSPATNKILPVPYDFDFSGLVSAPYASPAMESGLRTVQDRFLMSSGLKIESLKRATQQLRASKKELYNLCHSKYLSRDAEDWMAHYLDTFFEKIEQNEQIPATLIMPME
jgi:hypothetical protein